MSLVVLPPLDLHGLLSPEALQLQTRLGSLHPVEALSVVAAVLQEAAQGTDPAACNVLAQVRASLGDGT